MTPFAFGLSGMSTSRCFILNLIGALAWSLVEALVGHLFEAAARAVIVHVRKCEHQVIRGMKVAIDDIDEEELTYHGSRRLLRCLSGSMKR